MTLPFWTDEPDRRQAGDLHGGQQDRSGRARREEPRRVTLVRLSGEIARSLASIGRVAVEGEVHRPQKSRSGWTFFTLRDRAAQMPVVCPARHARRCRTVGGERVLVLGSLVWDNDRGQLVLEAEEVTPVGEGAVAAMIAETRLRLAADGLLDRPRRPVPLLPKVIGVLCGADAAVRKDIESVVAVRFPGYPLAVEETTVSGPGAAFAIVEALERLSRQPDVEVVVLARGGGDATALLPWSDEELCRAVAACPVPVVSAIGHESDRPLCDEVADLRCGTPSIAAHSVVPDRAQLQGELAGLIDAAARGVRDRSQLGRQRLQRVDIRRALGFGVERAESRLRNAGDRLVWAHPAQVAQACRRRLDACDWYRPMAASLASGQHRLDALARHARSLSPQRVIERGFAVVRRSDGAVVRGPEQVQPAEVLELTVAHGLIAARVEPRPADPWPAVRRGPSSTGLASSGQTPGTDPASTDPASTDPASTDPASTDPASTDHYEQREGSAG
jgi:exodeoxyribonuclease VII large subunit